MILMPDCATAIMDVFAEEPTLNITCDVYEPSTMQGYERDPRSAAKRAEEYLQSTGIADAAFFGPENEFFVFDDIRWSTEMHNTFYNIGSAEGAWHSAIAGDDHVGAVGETQRLAVKPMQTRQSVQLLCNLSMSVPCIHSHFCSQAMRRQGSESYTHRSVRQISETTQISWAADAITWVSPA